MRARFASRSLAAVLPLVAAGVLLCGAVAAGLSLGSGCGGRDEAGPPEAAVSVTGGRISGARGDGLRVYLGIPYAAPPVGSLRWRPPQPVEPWEAVRECVAYGPACPQPAGVETGFFPIGQTDEDCLYLNVWTPDRGQGDTGSDDVGESVPAGGDAGASGGGPSGSGLPVMVFLHGGGFASGSGSLPVYDGANLARLGAVVITVNYRLGPLGFLAHPALTREDPQGTSGNYGLLDQVAALEWVQANVAAFGGDTQSVTVFGESAGGMSICDLMVSPHAEGLFHRAIVQSGPFDARGAGMDAVRSLGEAETVGRTLSKRLGCDEAGDELAALRAVPADRLVEAAEGTVERLPGGIGFGPVVDGVVLPGEPATLFAAGDLHDVDLLVGANADEANLFLLGMGDLTPAQLTAFVRRLYQPYGAEVLKLFPGAAYGSRTAALSKAVTVMSFVASARFAAASVAEAGGVAYLYHFARRPPATGDLGSFHGLELPYVFGNSALTLDVTQGVDGALSQAMMRYWVSFAVDGDPNAAGLEPWPRYEPRTDRCLVLDGEIAAAPAPFPEACGLADRLRAAQ